LSDIGVVGRRQVIAGTLCSAAPLASQFDSLALAPSVAYSAGNPVTTRRHS